MPVFQTVQEKLVFFYDRDLGYRKWIRLNYGKGFRMNALLRSKVYYLLLEPSKNGPPDRRYEK